MKKFLSVLLTLIIVVSAVGICFAETGGSDVDIPDTEVPGAPNVDSTVYDEETTTIEEGDIPAGGSGTSTDSVTIEEEAVPQASSLPKTGGVSAEVFYAAGGLFVVAALVLTFAKRKTA